MGKHGKIWEHIWETMGNTYEHITKLRAGKIIYKLSMLSVLMG